MTETLEPIVIDAEEVSYARRPRLFWLTFDIQTKNSKHWTFKGPHRYLQGWGTELGLPPWWHTGYHLSGEKMVTRTCPGAFSTIPAFRTKG